MKFLVRKGTERKHKKDTWKTSAYSFVPFQTHFGELCGFADDIVEAGQGFGMHPHQNMEISTIVLKGLQAHKDNAGNEGLIHQNSLQTMSAGTGIMHSEFNASPTERFHSYQIWVYPKLMDVKPRHEQFNYQPDEKLNKFLLALSPDKRENSAFINQDAFFSLLKLEKDKAVTYKMKEETNGVYIHLAEGKVMVESKLINASDAIGVYETTEVTITSLEDAELILVEVPMQRGIKH